jgi:hypothetical protein
MNTMELIMAKLQLWEGTPANYLPELKLHLDAIRKSIRNISEVRCFIDSERVLDIAVVLFWDDALGNVQNNQIGTRIADTLGKYGDVSHTFWSCRG